MSISPMNSDNTTATKEAVAKKVSETDNKAHEHVKKLKESSLGKMVPTQYSNVTCQHIALGSFILMAVVSLCTYMFCVAIDGADPTYGHKFPTCTTGIILAIVLVLASLHDGYVYFAKNGKMLLSFLGFRALTIIAVIVAVLFINSDNAGFTFKGFLLVFYGIVCLFYTYIFSIFISEVKHGASNSDPSEHQAV
ncbi:hypothetical protein NEHOM01_0419 [Nematocida homosporus]|uniref:uncharacterized protein n=1 Tax=Nematocida homosporus TaxID=1912981 RepID=UPI00221EB728|nr:uncharacterized protein NEHOM01_0419 [Nematocida homosporus]KAI5184817.1 hypothetical protein NEHOM01_0419 [Nematocida homosporus]